MPPYLFYFYNRLPAEIRDRIIRHMMVQTQPLDNNTLRSRLIRDLQVSRQFRNEYLHAYFCSRLVLCAAISPTQRLALSRLFDTLGENMIKNARQLVIHVLAKTWIFIGKPGWPAIFSRHASVCITISLGRSERHPDRSRIHAGNPVFAHAHAVTREVDVSFELDDRYAPGYGALTTNMANIAQEFIESHPSGSPPFITLSELRHLMAMVHRWCPLKGVGKQEDPWQVETFDFDAFVDFWRMVEQDFDN